MHTYTDTRVYLYIPWTHNFVTNTVGCGTGHKYTNIHNFDTVRYCKYFTEKCYGSSLYI